MKAGATSVLAADIDLFAAEAISLNARANGVMLETTADDLLQVSPPLVDVRLVGDLFYEKGLAERLLMWLETARTQGCAVLIGDPGRSYLPRGKLVECASYQVPVTRDLEDAEIKRTSVWRLA
jgi:predicted nicotinamide N-methyase